MNDSTYLHPKRFQVVQITSPSMIDEFIISEVAALQGANHLKESKTFFFAEYMHVDTWLM